MFGWIMKMFSRKPLKKLKRHEMIMIETKQGIVSLPAPTEKQELVILEDGSAEIRTIHKERIDKSKYGL